MSALLRRALPYLLVAVALGVVVGVRVMIEGSRELDAGERALARGDIPDAVRRLRRAAHWYLPISPYSARAFERLESVASQAEAQGRSAHALMAWRAIRASALATRWLVVPQRDRMVRANRHIAALMAEQSSPEAGPARARQQEEFFTQLSAELGPEPAWVLVLSVGLLLWLPAAFWLARKGWDDKDRLRSRAALTAGAVTLFGLALFFLGIAQA